MVSWEDFTGFLLSTSATPVAYLPITFAFAILVAIILPIPIEVALVFPILRQDWGYLAAVTAAMAIGKTVGAWLIFYLGLRVEGSIRHWSERYTIARRVVSWGERFVRKTKYYGFSVLLLTPPT